MTSRRLKTRTAAVAAAMLMAALPAVSDAAPGMRSAPATADPGGVRDYWTPARMRSAEPVPAPAASDRAPAPAALSGPAEPSLPFAETSRAGTPPALAAPQDRARRIETGEVAAQTAYPQRTNGKLFFTSGGSRYVCSASVAPTKSDSVILTAGHCVFDRRDGWSRRILFVPAYRDGAKPFGSWSWDYETTATQWWKRSNFNYDYAAIKLRRNSQGSVGDVVGEQGIAWSFDESLPLTAIGYPGNRFDGERMWGCASALQGRDRDNQPGPAPFRIDCNLGEGASGGGWSVVDGGDTYAVSVTSYGYDNQPNSLYGPDFTEAVLDVLRRANRG